VREKKKKKKKKKKKQEEELRLCVWSIQIAEAGCTMT